ncbi:hypothetical protein [Winogradskyella sp. SYSU M77433]|uniref:hypothetical protein n=1 Tax=Winogradskyella sp. SYSU M77433 TaxID=3042722 RepID=UPI00247FF550|nr:hypothetical protein [Winogradskyella sp. SYSU M77433]MDH7914581.1 hypothetical protein [Winogradskyella sp. SYSU M77433]
MKKLLKLGKTLNKSEQKQVFGGLERDFEWDPAPPCDPSISNTMSCALDGGDDVCPSGATCTPFTFIPGHPDNLITGMCVCD